MGPLDCRDKPGNDTEYVAFSEFNQKLGVMRGLVPRIQGLT